MSVNSPKERSLELYFPLILLALVTLLVYFTRADLLISGWFYDQASDSWILQDQFFVRLVYDFGPSFTAIVFFGALALLILSYAAPSYFYKRAVAYLIVLAILITPVIIINGVLKNTLHRPRPRNVIEFGGSRPYLKPFQVEQSGFQGKSFPSGHASAGFILLFGYFLLKKRSGLFSRLFLVGVLIFGSWLSFSRIAMGGHFFSDTVWSLGLCWFTNYFLYYYWYLPYQYKISSRPAFKFERNRIWKMAGGISAVLTLIAFAVLTTRPFYQKLDDEYYELSGEVRQIEIIARVERGDIQTYRTRGNQIRVSAWAKGEGIKGLEVLKQTQVSHKDGKLKLNLRFQPSTWYWKYQSHIQIYVPVHIQTKWDLFTKSGNIRQQEPPNQILSQ
ncbi:MAG: phosphatase PAP2 family protein [Deltaproteobacteria bacterium]|nr:phosphatase PAP2 family protein [Deltaproteobacteria bacterium]